MTTVLKLGGELLDDTAAMRAAAAGIARLAAIGRLAIVHGGGRAIDADLRARGKAPRFVDGLRVTDEDTLGTVVGVLAGRINTAFVAALCAEGIRAVGLTGADSQIGLSRRATPLQSASSGAVDLGFVGEPVGVSARLVTDLLALGHVPVIASVGATADGTLLNVNADAFASHLAQVIDADRLIIAGSTPGVLDASGRTCPMLGAPEAQAMTAVGTARDGMVAKLAACLRALDGGVAEVRIVDGRTADYMAAAGTTVVTSHLRQCTKC